MGDRQLGSSGAGGGNRCDYLRDRLDVFSHPSEEEGMAYYALLYYADGDFVDRRVPYRQEHLQMAVAAQQRGELLLAGALSDPLDRALLVFRGESPEVARSFAENDPYVRSGIVKRWEVRPWIVVVGGDAVPPLATSGGR